MILWSPKITSYQLSHIVLLAFRDLSSLSRGKQPVIPARQFTVYLLCNHHCNGRLHDEMLDCASEHIRSLCVSNNSNFVLRSLEVSHVSFDMHGT